MNETKMSAHELSARLAEGAFGCVVTGNNTCGKSVEGHWPHKWGNSETQTWYIPDFTLDGNAMLGLIEKMRERGYAFEVACLSTSQFSVVFATEHDMEWLLDTESSVADTLPRAVAEAALQALSQEAK